MENLLILKSRSIYSLCFPSKVRNWRLQAVHEKIIGVILFRVSIPDTASVNSEANFLKHIFKECGF